MNERQRKDAEAKLAEMQLKYAAMLDYWQKLKGKCVLIFLPQHGIQTCFVVDVKSSIDFGHVAVRCNAANEEGGSYYDVNQLIIYHVYSEQEEAKVVSDYEQFLYAQRQASANVVPITNQ